LIRSNANPSIDMNNVDNPINLVYYLSREQYGEAPLLYGPHFNAQPNGIKEGEMKYVKGKDKYIPIGKAREYEYPASDKQIFPRIWDPSNDQGHANFYITWLDLKQTPDENDPSKGRYIPTYADNFQWFMTYQMDLMYWRYFMWNFSGKQNDIQGLGNVRDGNWITGISFIDNNRLGDQARIPDSIKHNKANNKLFLLPFILGIVGCIYQLLRSRKDWIVTFLLFFMTGIAVVIYLNQPGNQPRERDYAYVGSFYAFAIWIGLAVVGFVKVAREKANKKLFTNVLTYGSLLTFVISVMSMLHGSSSSFIVASLVITAFFALVTAAIILIARAVSSAGQNAGVLNIVTALICIVTPLLMAQQEWNDHDRSSKTLAPDLAKDYLESCAPNAILFTFGDNDTYPLWYAQEVEGVRPDIRIINNSLLGIDWYINQLRYKVNEAPAVDVIWTPEQIEGHNREYMRFSLAPGADKNAFYSLYDVMKDVVGKRNIDPETGRDVGPDNFPVARVTVPVDKATVLANGTANATDTVLTDMPFEIPEAKLRGIQRNDLMILNIIAANNWKRPIYFTSPYGELGFSQFLRKDGMAYRLVPIVNKYPQQHWVIENTIDSLQRKYRTGLGGPQITDNNLDVMYQTLATKFGFGGAGKPGVYFDEENRRHLLNIRSIYAEAAGNLADAGKKEEAIKLLDKLEQGISTENLPYGMTSRFNGHNQIGLVLLEAAYKAGKTDLAEKVRVALHKELEDQRKYYAYLKAEKPEMFAGSLESTESFLNDLVMIPILDAIEAKYAPQTRANQNVEGNFPTIQTSIKPDSGKPN
jgi:hypothetical protein